MSDVIRLLPDSIANQIAAGEVVQRPASVVKELLDNAIDAGSTRIEVVVKDAGRTLIQVIDNGCGMSERDARMAFERHATSKIKTAEDLFAIRTLGFRGEALPSIAAVAEVVLTTKRPDDELGTQVSISGSIVQDQRPVACAAGTNITVQNLFYNVPARRKFLKSNSTELRHIINEFQRIALAFPHIELSLTHNQTELFHLLPGNLRQRIIGICGKSINTQLIEIRNETSLCSIHGFITKPEASRKIPGDQYFFVNHRYIKHPFFHKAVTRAYEKLIPADAIPVYFIFFNIDPSKIDVNIHPTKTEVKFEDEQPLWHILHSVVKEGLGKFILAPSLDFENSGIVDIPVITKDTAIRIPETEINPSYNPFEPVEEKKQPLFQPSLHKSRLTGWEKLFETGQEKASGEENTFIETNDSPSSETLMNLKGRYILTPVKSGLLIIDQQRAHIRILYEKYMSAITSRQSLAQEWLYPVDIPLQPSEYETIKEHLELFRQAGFDMELKEEYTLVVKGCPAISQQNIREMIDTLLDDLSQEVHPQPEQFHEYFVRSLAKASAIPYGRTLSAKEMQYIIDHLFACGNPNYTPDGKPVMHIIPLEEIETKLK